MTDRKATARMRRRHGGANPVTVGALVLGVIVVLTYLGFTKHVPFTHGFRVKAVFTEANSIRKNSPVRIAGVNVGKVKDVQREPGTTAAVVTMELQDKALPIHKDATLKIRPRIFLEGNFFVDLKPGTPQTPTIGDGDTIPVTQTATPVQLDQVLTALQASSRDDLQAALKGFGDGLTVKPSAAEDAQQDPDVRGKTGAQALNSSLRTGGDALKNLSIVNEATLGTQQHDLGRLIHGLGTVTKALDRNESDLQGFVTNFNTTMASLASESGSLKSTVRLLGPTLSTAKGALTSLDAAFPNTRAFARDILPGVRETPATIKAAFPWIRQTRGLLQQSELRGLTQDLRPTTANLSKVVDTSLKLLPQIDLVAQCATKVVLPAGDEKIDDGALSTGAENYKEFWYAMVGLAGEGMNFDGNGGYVRFAVGGGDQTISTGKIGGALGDTFFGKSNSKAMGTRPAYPGHRPPYNPDVPCKDQRVPDFNTATVGPADGSTATRSAPATSAVAREAVAQVRSAGAPASPATSSGKTSLTDEIASRLNPFRTARAGK
ncbi:MlaD family protein [Paraconexibacter antarcticus]|uniref:MlaD family protein n=1 Tax=Paraconexibacter antarcticus TaxID=2949664 RepID=A0ABY5DUR8_9ACTN|nr:MlaD family protein [Paraconexibacter antarcticus]UTI65751.1 MlaD family protein [Paraconexibacter antarcticus]